MMLRVEWGGSELLKTLVQCKGDANARCPDGETVLMKLVQQAKTDEQSIRALVEAKAGIVGSSPRIECESLELGSRADFFAVLEHHQTEAPGWLGLREPEALQIVVDTGVMEPEIDARDGVEYFL